MCNMHRGFPPHPVAQRKEEEDGGGAQLGGGLGAARDLPQADFARAVLPGGLVADAPALEK